MDIETTHWNGPAGVRNIRVLIDLWTCRSINLSVYMCLSPYLLLTLPPFFPVALGPCLFSLAHVFCVAMIQTTMQRAIAKCDMRKQTHRGIDMFTWYVHDT